MPWIERPKRRARYGTNADAKKAAQRVYCSRRYRKIREAHIRLHPVCEVCELMGETAPVDHVHHLIPFQNQIGEIRDALAFDPSNLISVCEHHHKMFHNGYLECCEFRTEIKERLERFGLLKNDDSLSS